LETIFSFLENQLHSSERSRAPVRRPVAPGG
jgi:hypothetical protein